MGQLFPHLEPVWHSPEVIGTHYEPKFEFSGIPLSFQHAGHFISCTTEPVLAGEITRSGEPLVHIFDSHDMFAAWARNTRFAGHFEHIERVIARTRSQAPIKERDLPTGNFGRIHVATNANMDYDWLSAIEPRPIRMGASVTLFAEESFAGEQAVIGPSALKDLRDVDFFQRTRSISLHGVCLLTDDILFGGFRFYAIGDPFVTISNLHQWHFDRAAASAIIV
jgi:hypothetical protein